VTGGRAALAEAERLLRASLGSRLLTGHPLGPMTSFRIGGPAALFVQPEGDEDLEAVARAVRETRVPWFVIGKGSNVLVSDRGFAGLVLRLGRGFAWSSLDGSRLSAGAALPLPRLAGAALAASLTGLEFGVAIPASLGGAVRMNAGAHGRSMSDVVGAVELFSMEAGRRSSLPAAEVAFGYRVSHLPRGSLVVGATADLEPGEPASIRRLMDEARAWRRATQPLAEPNCGSVFTNPPGDHAARLVEEAGAKGLTNGGATVSTKHANFIVTAPGSTASDVLRLIADVRERVRRRSAVELELEVQLVGDFDDASN
jgi:UDP-N-acetylmuramate dehydrogenase